MPILGLWHHASKIADRFPVSDSQICFAWGLNYVRPRICSCRVVSEEKICETLQQCELHNTADIRAPAGQCT